MKEIYSKQLKETIFYEKLKNGLNVMLMPRKGFYRKYAIFAANYGSNDLNFSYHDDKIINVPEGIAHFLEHKLFEDKEGDVLSKFANNGASANAYTNFTTTAYLFSTTSNFNESLINLIDFVQTPHFSDESISREKEIIAQEINMYNDQPDYQVYSNMLTAMYQKHPVRKDIAGTIESIMKINKENLYLCYDNFYHPENMLLFLIGDIEPSKIISIIKSNQSEKKFKSRENIKKIYPHEPSSIAKLFIKKNMDVPRPILRLGIKENIFPDNPHQILKQELAVKILLEILLGKNSNIYQSFYDRGLIDETFFKYYNLETDYGYVVIGAETGFPDKLATELKEMLKKSESLITKDKFKDISNKIVGHYISGFNYFDKIASAVVDYHFKSINYFRIPDILKDINLSYLKSKYNQLFKKDFVHSLIKNK